MTRGSAPIGIRRSDYRLSANPEFADRLDEWGLAAPRDFDALLARSRDVPGGRAPQGLVEVGPSGPSGASIVLRLRPRRRGGVFARWLPDRFGSPRRGERELALWCALAARGIATPTPVAAVARRGGGLWCCHFVSIDRPAARDALAWIRAAARGERERGVVAIARTLRRLHDAGAVHGDLNLGNLLIEADADEIRCLVIDLDRARRVDPVPARLRMRELARLVRSLEKNGLAPLFDIRLAARAFGAYCAGDRRLRGDLLRFAGSERRRLRRHRLGWSLQRWLGSMLAGCSLFLLLACGPSADRDRDGARAAGDPAEASRFSLLAVGDTGRAGRRPAAFEGQLAVADAMTREARRHPVDALVFLGDNFYDRGLAEHALEARLRRNLVTPYCHFLSLSGSRSAAIASACEIPAAERRPVPIFAVLGNHDLGLPQSARLQREVIPQYLPDWRMSAGLTWVVEIHPGISLILFESELAIDDRDAIQSALVDAIRTARGPWRILATHRPIATDDLGRPAEGGYPRWVRDALARAGRPVQLVLCGHHHSLQAFALSEPTALLQIGAGSGSRAEPPLATGHPDLRHAALATGFVRVDLVAGAGDDGAVGGADDSREERLVVSLYRVPGWPWLARLMGHTLEAELRVDRAGGVEGGTAAGGEGSRPSS